MSYEKGPKEAALALPWYGMDTGDTEGFRVTDPQVTAEEPGHFEVSARRLNFCSEVVFPGGVISYIYDNKTVELFDAEGGRTVFNPILRKYDYDPDWTKNQEMLKSRRQSTQPSAEA